MKRVTLWNHSTYTRALLAESILHSQANHTLMAIQLSPVHLNGIQKIINKSIRKKKNSEDLMIEGRHLAAKNRTRAPITVGGLNMRVLTLKSEYLYTESGVRHLRRYYNGNAPRLIERYLQDLLAEDLLTSHSGLPQDAGNREKTD